MLKSLARQRSWDEITKSFTRYYKQSQIKSFVSHKLECGYVCYHDADGLPHHYVLNTIILRALIPAKTPYVLKPRSLNRSKERKARQTNVDLLAERALFCVEYHLC
ncbi:hypothetical protein EVAR_11758_1 [Eumeta japonica]|uniref:Uncharacterized protein n=1 Tax=Eumeta variegata TaxID=151549 RepID=A0A4C1UPP6_EUMVA|nr:hypothetical protein EVAR_11758_1 [Eumeta japonica]